MSKDTGGPAFPLRTHLPAAKIKPGADLKDVDVEFVRAELPGLSWLDYAAIHGPNPIPEAQSLYEVAELYGVDIPDIIAPNVYAYQWDRVESKARYDWAEAMLAEKRRRESEEDDG